MKYQYSLGGVSIQPKPDTGLKSIKLGLQPKMRIVSIQPKPDTGLKYVTQSIKVVVDYVSIQPKPDTGLKSQMLCKGMKINQLRKKNERDDC